MKKGVRNFLFWTAAILITIAAAMYQRTTGPTYPLKTKVQIDGNEYKLALKRSQNLEYDCKIALKNLPEAIEGKIIYRPYPTEQDWQEIEFQKTENELIAILPTQPAAGKLEYYVELNYKSEIIKVNPDKPAIIRFKGDVPAGFMIPHVLIMFLAMLFSNLTGLMAAFRDDRFRKYLNISFILLIAGGLILGPIIQKYAFGAYWTGFPNGMDLTDNKTLIVILVYALAVIFNIKKKRAWLALVAALALLLVYSIPHSLMGSEFNHETGEVVTGMIMLFPILR
ncbi:MAG: hypothetical protein GX879_11635 [Bacteroidales bacterium]|nr:hypothetical protein [Bacteroidales bacterium]